MRLVTVGIPFYNNENTLVDSIRSVFAQTYIDWELILINDASTDSSLQIAKGIRSPRVKLIASDTNRGPSYCRNQIAQFASGKYVAYLDADDMMHPERLARQVAYFDSHPETMVIGTSVYTVNAENAPIGIRLKTVPNVSPENVLKHCILIQTTVMGLTEWFRSNSYDESLRRAQDHELWCRTCQNSIFANIPDPLSFVREAYRLPQEYLKLYLRNCHFNRHIIRMHGPRLVGRAKSLQLILLTHMKGLSYQVATRAGLQTWLMMRRIRTLSQEERVSAQATIDLILKTSVPGLEEFLQTPGKLSV